MNIWLPSPLYHVFPLLSVLLGFFMAALMPNPLGVTIASGLYIYSFRILWLRTQGENKEKA